MHECLGPLAEAPWIHLIIGVSVLLDVFLPVLPSGILVITAATAASGAGSAAGVPGSDQPGVPGLLPLVLCAATASFLGDLVAYRLARRGGTGIERVLARSRRLATARSRLGSALTHGGGLLVVLARFAPAGRSLVSLGAGATRRSAAEFLPWSALAGLMWAGYSVGLGWFGGQWLGATWIATAVSVCALFLAGAVAAYAIRQPRMRQRRAEATV
ncbi:DedA family protein [Streptomyces meridianus]|uniref:VTT domain-containing protein n=1 Tax=Streptomyces meridianus TaxID=2938945 RepID=A0ABT0X9T8_9ACTN|nr:VTT domain-containing protein [Streptomyces meridianus]MCM2579295.1 VTT domain-containing protein [Streptomyces meridianus]